MGLLRARFINQWSGGVVVTPWEIMESPDYYQDWVEAAQALDRLPELVRLKHTRRQAIDDWFKQKQAQHPHYNRYRH